MDYMHNVELRKIILQPQAGQITLMGGTFSNSRLHT